VEKRTRILVVDDEPKISKMISDYLEAVGFDVESAENGIQALSRLEETSPDLMVLDVMMPGIDGFDVVRRIREISDLPVILLTARAAENDKLVGLELGADDYLTKPFSMKELAARIRAVLRRSRGFSREAAISKHILNSADIVLDLEKRTVSRAGKPVQLTGVQFDILAHLMENPGRVFTRMQLLESVQDHAFEGYERTIDVHIKNIRKALEPNPSRPVYILTVWGIGYKLAETGTAGGTSDGPDGGPGDSPDDSPANEGSIGGTSIGGAE
jgi:DNA-binding response OmpR family regulator